MNKFIYILIFQALLLFNVSAYAELPQPESPQSTPTPYFSNGEGPEFGESTFYGEMINMFITLGLIIGVLVALTWIMRKMQSSRVKFANEASVIKVLDHRPLSTKSVVYLLQVYDRAIVIADSQNGTSLLAEFPLENITGNETEKLGKKDFSAYLDAK